MDKNIEMSMLLDIYGKLLTEKQRDVLDLYYNENLSLSEIGENSNITRQGVRKSLVEAENKLLDYENKLGFLKLKLKNEAIINEIINSSKDEILNSKLKNLLNF